MKRFGYLPVLGAVTVLGLVGCGDGGGSSDSDSQSSDNASGGSTVNTTYRDDTWSVGNDTLKSLSYALGGASSQGNMTAIKNTSSTNMLLTASSSNTLFSDSGARFTGATGSDNSHFKTISFNVTTNPNNNSSAKDVFYAVCSPGSEVNGTITPAKITVGLVNDGVTHEQTFDISDISENNITPGSTTTWTMVDCVDLDAASVSYVQNTDLYSLNWMAVGEVKTVINTVLYTRQAVLSGQFDFDPEKAFAGSYSSDSDKPVTLTGVSVVTPSFPTGQTNTYNAIDAVSTSRYFVAYSKTQTNAPGSIYNVVEEFTSSDRDSWWHNLQNYFTGNTNEAMDVVDMALVDDKIYLISEATTGLVALDADGGRALPSDYSGETYANCGDAIVTDFTGSNGSTAKLWCHNKNDSGNLIEFAPPSIPEEEESEEGSGKESSKQ